jgi:hypothetical protein
MTNTMPPLPNLHAPDADEQVIDYARTYAEQVTKELRDLLCATLSGLGNGAFASPDCTIEFMREIPKEVAAVVTALRAEVKRLKGVAAMEDMHYRRAIKAEAEVERLTEDRDKRRTDNEAMEAIVFERYSNKDANAILTEARDVYVSIRERAEKAEEEVERLRAEIERMK